MRRDIIGIILIGIMLGIVIPAQAEAPIVQIVIPDLVEVTPGIIRLQEVAKVTGDAAQVQRLQAIQLGTAPEPGEFRWITRNYLWNRLIQAGYDETMVRLEMPERFQVVGASIRITSAMLQEQIRTALLPGIPKEWIRWSIAPSQASTVYCLPPGPYRIDVDPVESILEPGTNVLILQIISGDKLWRRLTMAVRIEAVGRVPVLKDDLESHGVLQPQNVKWEERPLKGNELLSLPAETQRAKHRLRRGEPIRKGDIEAVPLVLKGSQIILEVKVGQTSIRVQGKALRDGGLGETIPVQNISSRRVVHAVVTGEGKAEVKSHA